VSIEKNGPMTLREVADRLNISFVRIQQIEERVLAKAKQQFNEEDYLL
jgi:DNA-directed RNA polymerase sigma subunit (sigma70/sigma32)